MILHLWFLGYYTCISGNECRKILAKLPSLLDILPDQHLPYYSALAALHSLHLMVNKVRFRPPAL